MAKETYEITLRIVRDTSIQDNPQHWDWTTLVDSDRAVKVVECKRVEKKSKKALTKAKKTVDWSAVKRWFNRSAMKLYLVTWPNGTLSVLNACNALDLFEKLDQEASPIDENIKIQRIKPDENGNFHLTTSIVDEKIVVDGAVDSEHKLINYKFPKNILNQYFASLNWTRFFPKKRLTFDRKSLEWVADKENDGNAKLPKSSTRRTVNLFVFFEKNCWRQGKGC